MPMFLSEIFIENFRIFGSEADGEHLRMHLRPGLNLLAGENDSGKTAVIDAIRYVLWTTGPEYYRLTEDDFHVSGAIRSGTVRLSCSFSGLSKEDAGRFLEWLSVDDTGAPLLCVTLQATRLEDPRAHGGGKSRIAVSVRSGSNADGPSIEGEIREFLKVTYLQPLRDAEAELAAGRGSRLAQILESHTQFQDQGTSDFDPKKPGRKPKTLAGIMHQAEHLIDGNPVIDAAKTQLNEQYLRQLSVGSDTLQASIAVARSTELRQILEKLELWLDPAQETDLRTPRGLGFSNLLFMATELLLLGEGAAEALPLLLIEEPEAHLHPQMQLRLMAFLEQKCTGTDSPVQVLLTTHSPNLASNVDLESITLMHRGRAFALASDSTKLDKSDYRFLRRFLDVTKANLFFAKGVAIVEGDAENILLPVLADLLGRSFSKHGVSIVNVGSRGLLRYARIFQRQDGQMMPIRVACLADRDIPPATASSYVLKRTNRSGEELPTYDTDYSAGDIKKKVEALKARDEGSVSTYVSPAWTLEHDLALGDLALHVHVAIQLAKKTKGKADFLFGLDILQTICGACQQFREWRDKNGDTVAIAARIYEPLHGRSASKAETASFLAEILHLSGIDASGLRVALPEYIVNAIDYVTGQDAPGEDANAVED